VTDDALPSRKRRAPGKPGPESKTGSPLGQTHDVGLSARLREAVADDMPAIIAALITNAKAGDVAAARLITDKVWPSLRPESEPIVVAGLESGTLMERAQAVLSALGRGEMPPETAATVVSVVGNLSRIKVDEELEARIAALEARAGASE